jgi:hypothetical protein
MWSMAFPNDRGFCEIEIGGSVMKAGRRVVSSGVFEAAGGRHARIQGRGRVLGLRSLLSVALIAGFVLVVAEPAYASTAHAYDFSFPDSFVSPQGIAVDQSTGDVYVIDAGAETLDRFDANGNPVPFTASVGYVSGNELTGTPNGGFSFDSYADQVAINNSSGPFSGDIYVTENAPYVIDIFGPDGTYLGQLMPATVSAPDEPCGVAVNSAGVVFVGDADKSIQRFTPTSANVPISDSDYSVSVLTVSDGEVCSVAADASGDAYGEIFFDNALEEFSASQFPASGTAAGSASIVDATSTAVAVDPSNGQVYVDEGDQIAQYDTSSGTPALLDTFGSSGNPGALSGQSLGVAVDATSGNVYVSDAGTNTVEMFSTPTAGAPAVYSESATGVSAFTATLSANVNPDLEDTTYYFEYVDDANYNAAAPDPYSAGTQIPLPPGTDIGSGFGAQSASVNLTGLAATTTYHFRVVAINSLGTTDGSDQTFMTATPMAPSVDAESSSNVTSDSASLDAQINPNFADTTYYFEYVDDANYNAAAPDPYSAGTQIPLPPGTDIGSADTDQSVSVDLTGLTQTTLYHFRVVAINSVGTTYGADTTFAVYPYAPSVDGESASNVTANSATLNALINPEFIDTTYYFEYVDDANYNAAAPDPYSAGTQIPAPPGTDIGSAVNDQSASVNLAGLQVGVTYHFRVVAINALGTTYGTDTTFTTIPAVTNSGGGFGQTTATVSGIVNPQGEDAT